MTQQGAGAPAVTAAITTTHLVIIVILAILAILVIWWGGRRRRAGKIATDEAVHRREATGDAATPAAIERPLAERAPIETPPTASSPPPLADAPVIATRQPRPETGAADGDGTAPVTLLKGLGPKVAARLGELGVARVDQLAALSSDEAAALDGELGAFSGRMARDRWIEQAQLLTAGDRAGFEAKFGKLG